VWFFWGLQLVLQLDLDTLLPVSAAAAAAAIVAGSVVTNASRTNLMDLSTLNWHEPFLQLFKIPPGIMPLIVSNAEVYGHVAEGPFKGVPIAGAYC
jgi:glycerol kinase